MPQHDAARLPAGHLLELFGDDDADAAEPLDVTRARLLAHRQLPPTGLAPSATTTMLNFAPNASRR